MRRWMLLFPHGAAALALLACGGGDDPPGTGDAPVDTPPNQCEPLPATGQFNRRAGNPELIAGATFTDGQRDVAFSDPDLRFDGTRYELFYAAEHAPDFGVAGTSLIRRATSPDRATWTVDDAPALAPSTAVDAWDRAAVGAPSITVNPSAPAERRYLMIYAGSAGAFPHAGYDLAATQLGAAFSPDGITWTRASAAESPHGTPGLVIVPSQIYPTAVDAVLDDPEVVFDGAIYHLFFSGFSCIGADCATPATRGVGHATSADGLTWALAQAPVKSLLESSADELSGGGAPAAIFDAVHCRWELWQSRDRGTDVTPQPVVLDNTAGVWHADSRDAQQWSVFFAGPRDVAWNPAQPAAGEALGLRTGFDVADVDGGRAMVFVGYDDQQVPAGSVLPTAGGTRPGVMTINIATRDVP